MFLLISNMLHLSNKRHINVVERGGHGERHSAELGYGRSVFQNPPMLTDLIDGSTLLGVYNEHTTNQVTAVRGNVVRDVVLAVYNLREELLEAAAIKWQASAN
jgi:hypothetical protein